MKALYHVVIGDDDDDDENKKTIGTLRAPIEDAVNAGIHGNLCLKVGFGHFGCNMSSAFHELSL